MSKKTNHIHKYKRRKYPTGTEFFFCCKPGQQCYHKIECSLALGKPCECWVCGKEFNLDEYAVRLAKPRCVNCRKHKDGTPLVPQAEEVTSSTVSLMDRLRAISGGDSAQDKEDIL